MKISELLKLKAVDILGNFQKTVETEKTYSMEDVAKMLSQVIEGVAAEADRIEENRQAEGKPVRQALSVALDALGADRTLQDRRAALGRIGEIMK
jgi:uncharacterized protein YicC (UPF0701 family)